MSRHFAVALLVVAAACNRHRSHEPPRPAGSPQDTWVARPAELTDEQIRAVQRALADRGFAIDATGKLDGRTRTALGDFQRSRGLPVTGNLNPETADALGLDPVAVTPVRPAEELPDAAQDSAADAPATRPSRDAGAADAPEAER